MLKRGVGAVVSQFETHPSHGPDSLKMLETGMLPDEVITALLKNDGQFDDGTISDRQVSIVDTSGVVATHTGSNALQSNWAGQLSISGVTVQGNGLAGEKVLSAMFKEFRNNSKDITDRLMDALEAGQMAGGQKNGKMSAALLIKTPKGFPFDIDLRVDADSHPIKKLRDLLDLHQARQLAINARRVVATNHSEAKRMLSEALVKGGEWDRVLVIAIEVALCLDDEVLVEDLKNKLQTVINVMYSQTQSSKPSRTRR